MHIICLDGWRTRGLFKFVNGAYRSDEVELLTNEDFYIVLVPPTLNGSFTKAEILSHYKFKEYVDVETFEYYHPKDLYVGAIWTSSETKEFSRRHFYGTYNNQKVWCDDGYSFDVIQNSSNIGWVNSAIVNGEAIINVRRNDNSASLREAEIKDHVYIEKVYPYTRNERILDSKTIGEFDHLYNNTEKKLYGDNGLSSWTTNNTITMPINHIEDKNGIVIEIDDQIKCRIMIYDALPSDGGVFLNRVNWTTGLRRMRIPPNFYFIINFRNIAEDNTISKEFVKEHTTIYYYDELSTKYINDAIEDFENALLLNLDNYPILFGVITDVHYPTNNDYSSTVYRRFIENGCYALNKIANDLNLSFIVDCGDDAGYSSADNQVSNIIYSMVKIMGCLSGNVPVMMINGNHEAFQNNSNVDATDIYRSRIINQTGCTFVSNKATNFYIDDEFFKIRYVFFDTECRTDYTHSEAEADLVEMFSSAPNDYSFILFSHRDITNNTQFANAVNFVNVITDYVPRILFHITGHTHADGYYENAGIKNINFIAGGCYNYEGMTNAVSRYGNTDKESSFAVIGYSPELNKVKVFGYGMASDREFDLS